MAPMVWQKRNTPAQEPSEPTQRGSQEDGESSSPTTTRQNIAATGNTLVKKNRGARRSCKNNPVGTAGYGQRGDGKRSNSRPCLSLLELFPHP